MRRFVPRAKFVLRRFSDSADGAIALIFGLLFIPLMLAAGVALDYGRAANVRYELQRRSDGAALAAARTAATYMRQCTLANIEACRAAAKVAGKKAGNQFYAALNQNVSNLSTEIDLTSNTVTGAWTAAVSFSGKVPTTLMKIATIEKVPVEGSTKASVSLGNNTYLNFYLLLDNSSSMGIAATTDDMQRMISLTEGKTFGGFSDVTNCVFACHQPEYSSVYYDYPKSQGVRFRIDDLRDATTALLATAKQAVQLNSYTHIGIGAYTFNESVHTLSAVTTNLDAVSSAVASLDLPTVPDGTQIADAVSWLEHNAVIGSGTGTSPTKPLEIAFLVTDGVENGANTGWRSTNAPTGSGYKGAPTDISGTISANACEALKQKGVTVAVVYTTYLPFPGTWRYDNMVQPFASNIAPRLESCASPGYFFTASEPGDIKKGMQELFQKALHASALRLTN